MALGGAHVCARDVHSFHFSQRCAPLNVLIVLQGTVVRHKEGKRMRQFFPTLLKKQQGNRISSKAVSSRWFALALLCCAQFMVVLDVQVVAIALPAIQREFAISQTNLQWVINAYVLLFGGLLMLAGRAADLFGRRRFFIGGLLLFALAALGCGLARSEAWLIAARALQGLNVAEQGLVAGLLNTAAQLGTALGLALLDTIAASSTAILKSSGYTDAAALVAGFRWAFFVSAGVAVVGVLVAVFVVDHHPNS